MIIASNRTTILQHYLTACNPLYVEARRRRPENQTNKQFHPLQFAHNNDIYKGYKLFVCTSHCDDCTISAHYEKQNLPFCFENGLQFLIYFEKRRKVQIEKQISPRLFDSIVFSAMI